MHRNFFRNLLVFFIIYSLALLLIGRNLTFLPQIGFHSSPKTTIEDTRKNVVEKFLNGQKGSYSVYFKDLKTGAEFGIDENKIHTAASLNKLPIIFYMYNLAGHGKIDLEDQIIIQEDDIQDYGTGSLRYEDPGGSYSLKNLAKLSLKQSDNTAAHVLGVRLDLSNVQNYIKSEGMLATNMDQNTTSAKDMGKLLDDFWYGKVVNTALKFELLDFMRDTDFEDRLALDLPKNVKVYHKAADGAGFVHDAGIIDDGKNPFILTVLSSDVLDDDEAKKTIGKIAKFIYDTR